jgi:hypothetical protein
MLGWRWARRLGRDEIGGLLGEGVRLERTDNSDGATPGGDEERGGSCGESCEGGEFGPPIGRRGMDDPTDSRDTGRRRVEAAVAPEGGIDACDAEATF